MTTFSAYTTISKDLGKWRALTAQTPTVKNAVAAYGAGVAKVRSIDDFLGDRRVFAFAMTAYGLADKINSKALIRKVLEGGVSDTASLAHKLNDPRVLAFAKAFDFKDQGVDAVTSAAATKDVIAAYVQQALETDQGAKDKGVQLALYFARKAPSVSGVYQILADKNLLTVAQTALGISPMTAAQSVDKQAANLKRALDIADLSDPKKLRTLIDRFAARYDAATASAAAAGPSGAIGVDLMIALQGFRTGGA